MLIDRNKIKVYFFHGPKWLSKEYIPTCGNDEGIFVDVSGHSGVSGGRCFLVLGTCLYLEGSYKFKLTE